MAIDVQICVWVFIFSVSVYFLNFLVCISIFWILCAYVFIFCLLVLHFFVILYVYVFIFSMFHIYVFTFFMLFIYFLNFLYVSVYFSQCCAFMLFIYVCWDGYKNILPILQAFTSVKSIRYKDRVARAVATGKNAQHKPNLLSTEITVTDFLLKWHVQMYIITMLISDGDVTFLLCTVPGIAS